MGNVCGRGEKEDYSGPVDLFHFDLLRSVGRGAFGKVMVVRKKDTKEMYALKYINKEKCIKQRAVRNIIRERRMLEELRHPFLCNLKYAFQDDQNMFMVLDLMIGGDLRFHLDHAGCFKEDVVRYQTSQIVLGLEYLHAHDIVHRDIKPANILIDEAGHCHITDFNVAARIKPDKPITSTAGTYKYMAPEVIQRKGYFTSPDWWSLGVLMFECLFGRSPFRGKTREQISVSICAVKIHYPSKSPQVVSTEARNAIVAFLQPNIETRLGCSPRKAIRTHEFFKSLDFAKVLEMSPETPPLFVPDATRLNFDVSYELEEVLLEDNPLRHTKRKKSVAPVDGVADGGGGGGGGGVGGGGSGSGAVAGPSRRESTTSAQTDADAHAREYATMEKNFLPFDWRRRPGQRKSAQSLDGTHPSEGRDTHGEEDLRSDVRDDRELGDDMEQDVTVIKEYDGKATVGSSLGN